MPLPSSDVSILRAKMMDSSNGTLCYPKKNQGQGGLWGGFPSGKSISERVFASKLWVWFIISQPHLPILQINFMTKTYTDSKSNWKNDCNLGSTSLVYIKSSKLKSRQKIYWSFFPRPGKKLRSRFQTRQFIHWKNGLYLEPSFFNRPHIVWSKVHQISNG